MLIKKILCGIILVLSGVNLLYAVVPDTLTIQGTLSTPGTLIGVQVNILRDGEIAQSLAPLDLETDAVGVFTAVLPGINKSVFSTGSVFAITFSNSNGDLLGTVVLNSVPFSIRSESSVSADILRKYITQAADEGITLTSADFGKTITVDSASDKTVTLPSVSADDIGAQFTIMRLGTGKLTITTSGSAMIYNASPGGTIDNGSATEVLLTMTLRLATDTKWVVIGGNGSWAAATNPQNLTATAGNQQITLNWSAPVSDGGTLITGYKIYRNETYLVTVGSVLTYIDTGLTNGSVYSYKVSAVNGYGESPQSNEANATPVLPPPFCSATADKKTSGIVNGDVVFCDNSLKLWTPTIPSNVFGAIYPTKKTWGPDQYLPSHSCIGLGASFPACDYCDTLNYAGSSDWVLPSCTSMGRGTGCQLYVFGMDACGWTTSGEQSECRPAWDIYAQGVSYWSSTDYGVETSAAWNVSPVDGSVGNSGRMGDLYVRCVHAGPGLVVR